jgi:hypothetical protein
VCVVEKWLTKVCLSERGPEGEEEGGREPYLPMTAHRTDISRAPQCGSRARLACLAAVPQRSYRPCPCADKTAGRLTGP